MKALPHKARIGGVGPEQDLILVSRDKSKNVVCAIFPIKLFFLKKYEIPFKWMSDEGERVDAVVGQDSFEDRQVGTLEVRLPLEMCGGGAEEEFGD